MDSGGELITVHLANDTLKSIKGKLETTVMDIRGRIVQSVSKDIYVRPNASSLVQKLPMLEFDKHKMVVLSRLVDPVNGRIVDEADQLFVPWLDFEFEEPVVEIKLSNDSGRKLISLKSDRFIQGSFLPLDETIVELSDNFFSLFPGVVKEVEYTGTKSLDGVRVRFPLLSRG